MARFWATPRNPLTSARRWFAVTSRVLSHAPGPEDPIFLPSIVVPVSPVPVVLSCTCGRKFNSDDGLRSHRIAKTRAGILVCEAQPVKPQLWLWKHVDTKKPIRRIEYTAVQPSDTPVSSASASEIVCSYNWRRHGVRFYVPGAAPSWQNRLLPVALKPDQGLTFRDHNAARMPRSPFRPLFQATATMNPSFCFDSVDVLADRTTFCRLLDFSAGRRQESFRLHLYLIRRTLVIERYDESARAYIPPTARSAGWGKGFEGSFTQYAKEWKDSDSHHRALRYQFGDLSCVVRIEVDACLRGAAGRIATNPVPIKDPSAIERLQRIELMAWAAEIKTANRNGPSKGQYLPQLWFGRTPWLIHGRHQNGIFKSVEITNMEPEFEAWETKHQEPLRKMAAVLAQLRTAVEENRGNHCVAICEGEVLPPAMGVFPSEIPRHTISPGLQRKLWHAEDSEAPTGETSAVQSVNRETVMR